jgi:hypothetical protein
MVFNGHVCVCACVFKRLKSLVYSILVVLPPLMDDHHSPTREYWYCVPKSFAFHFPLLE